MSSDLAVLAHDLSRSACKTSSSARVAATKSSNSLGGACLTRCARCRCFGDVVQNITGDAEHAVARRAIREGARSAGSFAGCLALVWVEVASRARLAAGTRIGRRKPARFTGTARGCSTKRVRSRRAHFARLGRGQEVAGVAEERAESGTLRGNLTARALVTDRLSREVLKSTSGAERALMREGLAGAAHVGGVCTALALLARGRVDEVCKAGGAEYGGCWARW